MGTVPLKGYRHAATAHPLCCFLKVKLKKRYGFHCQSTRCALHYLWRGVTRINGCSPHCPFAGRRGRCSSCPALSPRVSARVSSRTCQARRGQPRRLDCACVGPFLRLCAGVMAASMATRARSLLWAGAAWLRPGGIRELLRPRIEGGAPGRDFSLSHYRVRAGRAWGGRR